MAAIPNMTAVAANELPTLRATPLFNTPIKGMPAPASRDHAAKIKYERIWVCSYSQTGMAPTYSAVHRKPERNQNRPLPNSIVGRSACAPARAKHRHGSQGQVRCTGSVVVLTRQRRLPFLHVLPTLVEDLLDIVGRSYDGIDYVVLHHIHETMLDPSEPLAAVGV